MQWQDIKNQIDKKGNSRNLNYGIEVNNRVLYNDIKDLNYTIDYINYSQHHGTY